MKKIGLVPLLYDEYNYGGILQFYALQHVLKNNGFEVEIIFFDNDEKICSTLKRNQNKTISKLRAKAYKLLHEREKRKLENVLNVRRAKIDLFKKQYYCQTVNSNEINYDNYAGIICGSDQIWNPLWARRRAFLEFVPDRINKIIYGASLGCETMTMDQKKIFKPRIERLQHVSVREYSAKKLLDSFIDNVDIKLVVDPTLLLLPDEWKKLIRNNGYKKYIFTYFLGEYSDKKDYIQKIADRTNLKIINIKCASGERLDKNCFGDHEIIDADPGEFLGLISGAEYVFTDSFHACVFSVLFKKQFFVFKRDSNNKMFGRIDTLFEHFHLPNRNIAVNRNIDDLESIDYTNDILQIQLRAESLEYLFGSIRNEKN